MIRRTAMLSTLTLTLLLGACTSKNDQEATAGEGDEVASASMEGEPAGEDTGAPPPQPKVDYWPVVGPLVAGSYSGGCMRKPDLRKMDATVIIGADGKASSNGLAVDFRESKEVMLMRTRHREDYYTAMAMFSVNDAKGGMLSLHSGQSVGESMVSLERDEVGIMCSHIGGTDKLSAQPLYRAVSRLFDGARQTLSCLDTSNLLVRRDVDVEVADGVIKAGDATYDLKTAVTESVSFSDAGEGMSLAIVLPEERGLTLIYDGAGKLTHFAARDKQAATHSCDRKD